MNLMKNYTLIIFVTVFIFASAHILNSCASSVPYPTQEMVRNYSTEAAAFDDAVAGRELYVKKCSGCHSLYVPQQYTASAWDSILLVMNPKAKVSHDESSKIRLYLSLYSRSLNGTN